MYERFTDRARKVMALAKQEAQCLNHEYIGTEHILLGLIQEGTGVGANVLKNLDVNLRKARNEVERLVQPGPDMVTVGKLPMMPRAKQAIERALVEARELNHNYVGTEHLLLGLAYVRDGVAANVLENLDLDVDLLREQVLALLGAPVDDAPASDDADRSPPPRMGGATREVYSRAARLAATEGVEHFESHHLLIALAGSDSRAGRLLRDAGLTPKRIDELLRDAE